MRRPLGAVRCSEHARLICAVMVGTLEYSSFQVSKGRGGGRGTGIYDGRPGAWDVAGRRVARVKST
jgi:hypothetical protein